MRLRYCYRVLVLFGLLTIITASCTQKAATTFRDGKPQVYTVNYPLMYFVERIGGDHISVHFPAPPDEDPAFWTPEADTVARYQDADLILLNGAAYAKWTQNVSLPPAKLINTSEGVQKKYIKVKGGKVHQHGPKGKKHSHAGTAFTTWLDPTMALAQARVVKNELVKLLPDKQSVFEQNFAGLENDLSSLDKDLAAVVAGKNKTPLAASHPVYQYLARRYDLNLKSVHWEPDQVPDAKGWKEFDDLIAKHPATVMIWEGAPAAKTTAILDGKGIKSIVYEPAGNKPSEGDFMTVMRQNLKQLGSVFDRDDAGE